LRTFPHGVIAFVVLGALCAAQTSHPKKSGSQRIFPQSVGVVQAALKQLPGGASGQLPLLDGFVVPGPVPLSSYKRPYYQCEVHIAAVKGGGSLVQVTAKITAWFSTPAHSGYEVLQSNGRLESDLLDRMQDALDAASPDKPAPGTPASENPSAARAGAPEIDAPVPQIPDHAGSSSGAKPETAKPQDQLQAEANNLEEILRNQSHPTNLVAVRQDGTPLLQNPALDAKVLFLASAEDEFEILDETPGWVHVRISGLARGWLRRSTVEPLGDAQLRPDDEPSAAKVEKPAQRDPELPAMFSISSEEVGSFAGEWAPLKGKNVKIISLQQAPGSGRITSPQEKKQFAESLFRKESQGLSTDAAGVMLIFDAEDGGVLAATRTAINQWNSGALSNAAFWKQCFLDPPDILGAN